ncbi:PREDICTED: butyrophilin subfamily 1 member A1-like [Crocodylus porosus]|nr:PREDICTED: butyrophilin subfamily 1 member A1-like [Crocodylus porosus]
MWASSAALGPDWTGSCCLLRDAVAITICLLLCVQTSASDSGSDPLLHIMIDDSGGIRVTCLSAGWFPEPQLLWTNSRGETLSPDSQEKDSSDRSLFNLSSSVVLTESSDPVLSCTVRPSSPDPEKKTSISITGLFPQSSPEKAVLWVLLTVALLLSLLGAYLFRRFCKEHEEASKELELRQFLKAVSLSAAEVNLAEDTAYPCFILSEDRRSVTHGAIWKDVPQTTKRFSCLPCVLASKSFRSGKWYWDVEVGSWGSWAIGVAKVSVERTGEFLLFPDMGVWALQCMEGQWEALTIPRTRLCMEEKPRKIRVQVDCERQSVSFYEAEDLAHIFTFPCCSWELVSPFFALWTMGTELRILPPGCLGREESSHVSCDPDVDDESVPLSFGQLQGRVRT